MAADQVNEVMRQAQHLWLSHYGAARSSPAQQRVDAGTVRLRRSPQAGAPPTEAGFLAERSAAVAARHQAWLATGLRRGMKARTDAKAAAVWDERLEKEATWQRAKRRRRLIDAEEENQTLPKDLDTKFEQDKADAQNNETRAEAKHLREHARRSAALRSVSLGGTDRLVVDFKGRTVFVGKHSLRCQPGLRPPVLVKDRHRANTFMASDFQNPGQRIQWHLALRGGLLATPEYIESGGSASVAVMYQSSLTQSRRRVWCSSSWAEKHPALHAILTSCVASPRSRWLLVEGNLGDFLRHAKRSNPVCVGLAAPREKMSPQLRHHRRALTAAEFIRQYLQPCR